MTVVEEVVESEPSGLRWLFGFAEFSGLVLRGGGGAGVNREREVRRVKGGGVVGGTLCIPTQGVRRRLPAQLFVCVHTVLACVRGAGTRRPMRSGDALTPSPRGDPVPPGLVVVCVSAPAPWFLGEGGSCGRGLGEILGLLVSRVGERGPGQRRAAVPLLASRRLPPTRTRQAGRLLGGAAGWSGWAWRSGGALVRFAPPPPSLTLGPGRAVGVARSRSGRCLRRSWRESAPLRTPPSSSS